MSIYIMCRYAVLGLTVTCSIFTLTALSIDHYFTVIILLYMISLHAQSINIDHYFTVKAPTRRSQQLDSGQRGAIVILIAIWVISIPLTIYLPTCLATWIVAQSTPGSSQPCWLDQSFTSDTSTLSISASIRSAVAVDCDKIS